MRPSLAALALLLAVPSFAQKDQARDAQDARREKRHEEPAIAAPGAALAAEREELRAAREELAAKYGDAGPARAERAAALRRLEREGVELERALSRALAALRMGPPGPQKANEPPLKLSEPQLPVLPPEGSEAREWRIALALTEARLRQATLVSELLELQRRGNEEERMKEHTVRLEAMTRRARELREARGGAAGAPGDAAPATPPVDPAARGRKPTR